MSIILAQYTIRSKQEYIFRSNRMAEIIGASENISRSWDILFDVAQSIGKKTQRINPDDVFSIENTKQFFSEGTLQMAELFCGGGNETILYDSVESFQEVNKAFSYHLLKKYPGMIPMAVCTIYTGDYQKDYSHLMEEADKEKQRMTSGQRFFILPFSMMDRNTFQPYSRVITMDGKQSRVTEESYAKRKTGQEISKQDPKVKILDKMVTQKGDESLLAVVHADGNNMGAKIQDMLKGTKDYDFCVNHMRQFTTDTDNAFVTDGLQAIEIRKEELIEEKKKEGSLIKEEMFLYRRIISDGDDMTFVCNARYALDYTKAYLQAVQSYKERNSALWSYSSCAGICIFHSHYPFSMAYAMAEQACDDSAKKKVHGNHDKIIEEGWADFHYIHQGIGGSLEHVRQEQGTLSCQARPWKLAGGKQNDPHDIETMLNIVTILKENHVSRSDLKTLAADMEESISDAETELIRIYGHHKVLQAKLESLVSEQVLLLKILYDLTEMYDLWFSRRTF